MTNDLQAIETWAATLLARLTPAARRRLTRQIAIGLRQRNSQRIAAQKNPDGSAYEPRKPRKDLRGKRGALRRKMFSRLRQARLLSTAATPESASVGFLRSGLISHIARIHQEGRTDRVSRSGPYVQYPERRLLGFTPADLEYIEQMITSATS